VLKGKIINLAWIFHEKPTKMGQNAQQIQQNSLEGKGLVSFPRRSSAEGAENLFATVLRVLMKYPG